MILRRHFEQEIKMINREISKRERKAITEVLENAAVIFARIVADQEHPPRFTDLNYGYGVLHEEVKETMFEIESIEMLEETIDNLVIANDTENLKLQLDEMKRKSLRAMEELAQLAAVSDKFIDSIKAGENDGIHAKK